MSMTASIEVATAASMISIGQSDIRSPRRQNPSAVRGGYTSMDDGYSSQGGYSSYSGMWSSREKLKHSHMNGGTAGTNSGNGSSSGRRRTTPPSSPRQRSRYYGDRKHARQYLKNMQRIHTTYTPFWLVGHIGLILYRIIMLLGTPSPFQLVSFTHLVYLTDTAFHIFSLAWHLLRFPKLERITVIYGTWIVWIGWGLAIWLSDPDMEIHQQEHRAAFGIGYSVNGLGSSDSNGGNSGSLPWYQPHHTYGSNDSVDINKLLPLAPFVKKYSNWYILYMPVATFLGLLMFRRNLWGLISWEHLTRMEQIGQLKYYRIWCLWGVGAGWAVAWKVCRWWFHVPFMPMDDPTFCRYASSGKSCLDLLEATAAAQRSAGQFAHIAPTVVRYRTDVIEFRFWPMILSNLVMGLILMCWWSFWTFQYQGVVWREDLKEGWAVWRTTTGGVMTGLVTDEELRKSVKDWTSISNNSNSGDHYRDHREHREHAPRHGANPYPSYSGSTTPQYSC
ncbi:hypothetical protein BGZ49_010061 [Haplosporangium sp. Z 27]|nr:hypothetical protein BGZ49_010061 [Haplosporangium sp. Z 27]